MWKRVAIYGGLLAAGTLVLEWLDYKRLARAYSTDIVIGLVALGFLTLGVWAGMRVTARRHAPFDGNPQAVASLGISAREMDVLKEIAAGYSTKEIALRLNVSPNTIKTHTARLFEKLGAQRRTDAINRARELGILS